MALLRRPVILLQTLAASEEEARGNSLITVFSPMLDISRNCSFSDTIFVQRASTMVSTWYSFTLFTSGPRLKQCRRWIINLIHFLLSLTVSQCDVEKCSWTFKNRWYNVNRLSSTLPEKDFFDFWDDIHRIFMIGNCF